MGNGGNTSNVGVWAHGTIDCVSSGEDVYEVDEALTEVGVRTLTVINVLYRPSFPVGRSGHIAHSIAELASRCWAGPAFDNDAIAARDMVTH